MKLTTEALARPQPNTTDLVARQGWLGLLLFVLVAMLVGLLLVLWPYWTVPFPQLARKASPLLTMMGVFFLLILMLFFGMVRAAQRPTAWVAVFGPHGVKLKFRSYLHWHWPASDATVLLLGRSDIEAIAQRRETMRTTDFDGVTYTRTENLYIALRDPLPDEVLARMVDEEMRLHTSRFGVASRYGHLPVRASEDGRMLHLVWRGQSSQLTPPIKKAWPQLLAWYRAQPLPPDFTFTPRAPRMTADDEARIRALAASGKKLEAIRLLRQFKKIGLKDARQRIESGVYE